MWSCKRGSYWTSLHKSTASLSWMAVCNGDNAFRFLKQAQQVRFHLKKFICISKMSCNFFAFVCQNLLPIWFLIVTKQLKFAGVKWALGKHTRQLRKQCFPKPPGGGALKWWLRFHWERNLRMFHIVYIGCKKRSAGKCQIGMYKIAFFFIHINWLQMNIPLKHEAFSLQLRREGCTSGTTIGLRQWFLSISYISYRVPNLIKNCWTAPPCLYVNRTNGSEQRHLCQESQWKIKTPQGTSRTSLGSSFRWKENWEVEGEAATVHPMPQKA